jgi:hypothetical protein
MYRRFGVVHHGDFPVSFVLIFEALFGGVLRTISWGFWGVTYEVIVPLWLVTLPSNPL